MAEAKRDNNNTPTLLAVSNADSTTPVVLWADPTTHRLLVSLSADLGDLTDVTITSEAQGDILYNNGSAWVNLAPGNSGEVLQTQGAGANPQWAAAGGDVTGPASSTDNAVVRFDGTGGKTLQNSGVTISDSDVVTAASLNLTANSNQIVLDSDDGSGFTTTITDSATAARVITLPDATDTLVGLDATQTLTNKTMNDLSNMIGADEVHFKVFNNTGGTLTAGTVVYISGYNVGQDAFQVTEADADNSSAMPAVGIIEDDISTGTTGHLVVSGVISGLNTASWSVGDELYVSTTAGVLTNTKPTGATSQVQKMALVTRSHASLGRIMVIGAGRSNDIPNTMLDTVVRIVDDGDTTKVLQFQCSGITTGTTRTVTIPDASGTLLLDTATQTLTNKTLTRPKVGTSLDDTNGNEIIETPATASAVNHVAITNAATGNHPAITAEGSDSNIDLRLGPKGAGRVKGHYRRFMVRLYDNTTALATATGIAGDYRIANNAITVKAVGAYVDTAAATGSNKLTVDINEAGTTILSTKITIDVGEKTSTTAATAAVISDSSIAADAIITFDIDQVNETTPATGLVVWIDYIDV